MFFSARDYMRFWANVAIAAGGCAEWQHACYPDGYGVFHWAGENHGAHRISWQMAYGAIPDGVYVLHRCDNRRCVEPGHLFLGTHVDNMADMDAKGRRAAQDGASNGNARLTPEEVGAIRADGRGSRVIGREYGVSKTTVNRIRSGELWAPKREMPR